MKNQNVLIITDHVISGGATSFIHGLINELLSQKNVTVYLATFHPSGFSISSIFFKKSNLHHFNLLIDEGYRLKATPKRIILLHQLLSRLDRIDFKLVFTDLVYPTLAFQVARTFHPSLRNVPLYHHIHGSFSEETKSQELQGRPPRLHQIIKYRLLRHLEHQALAGCQQIFVYSHYSQNLTKKLHGNLPVEINKPGIDFSFPKATKKLSQSAARNKLGLNLHDKYILFTSRIEPRKGVSAFFENLSHPQLMKAKFIVCSHFIESGYLYGFLKTLDKINIGSQLFLVNTPSRQELSLLYRAADVTIMPSIDLETFGFSTLESYYYHTPVVAFDIGANSELVPNSHLVKYPSKNSWKNLYQKIAHTLEKSDSRDYSQYNYSWKKYVDKLLSK